MKCLNCEKEAKWKSAIYVSPLCSTCARKEVDNLIKTGKYSNLVKIKKNEKINKKELFTDGTTEKDEN